MRAGITDPRTEGPHFAAIAREAEVYPALFPPCQSGGATRRLDRRCRPAQFEASQHGEGRKEG